MKLLKLLWRRWLPIAQAIGNFQAQVILSVFYFVIFLPLGMAFRLFADPYNLKKILKTNFSKWQHSKENLESAKKQY